MGTPRVSVGLPVRNGGDYLRGALDSLLAQTLADFELMIADNASTDNTERSAASSPPLTTASDTFAMTPTSVLPETSTSSSGSRERRTSGGPVMTTS
jgi:GT2 family glycosyltransferase